MPKPTDLPCRQRDPELWFPVGTGPLAQAQGLQAKALCDTCPVKEACLATALLRGEQEGIWGGTDGAERRQMWLRQRKATGATVVRRTDGDHRQRLPLVRVLASQA